MYSVANIYATINLCNLLGLLKVQNSPKGIWLELTNMLVRSAFVLIAVQYAIYGHTCMHILHVGCSVTDVLVCLK